MIDTPQPTPELDRKLTVALERKPAVQVPPDFAARVAAAASRVPAGSIRRRRWSYGMLASTLALLILLAGMFSLAAWAQPGFQSFAFDIELLLAVQMLALLGWLLLRRRV